MHIAAHSTALPAREGDAPAEPLSDRPPRRHAVARQEPRPPVVSTARRALPMRSPIHHPKIFCNAAHLAPTPCAAAPSTAEASFLRSSRDARCRISLRAALVFPSRDRTREQSQPTKLDDRCVSAHAPRLPFSGHRRAPPRAEIPTYCGFESCSRPGAHEAHRRPAVLARARPGPAPEGDAVTTTMPRATDLITGETKNPRPRCRDRGIAVSGGGRIRTDDLEVMSLASYLAAPPRVRIGHFITGAVDRQQLQLRGLSSHFVARRPAQCLPSPSIQPVQAAGHVTRL